MLTFNLKKEWFDKIKSEEKTVEYREYKPYWITRIKNCLHITDGDIIKMRDKCLTILDFSTPIAFKKGYTNQTLLAIVRTVKIVNGKYTDLAIDKPVFAIEFELMINREE